MTLTSATDSFLDATGAPPSVDLSVEFELDELINGCKEEIEAKRPDVALKLLTDLQTRMLKTMSVLVGQVEDSDMKRLEAEKEIKNLDKRIGMMITRHEADKEELEKRYEKAMEALEAAEMALQDQDGSTRFSFRSERLVSHEEVDDSMIAKLKDELAGMRAAADEADAAFLDQLEKLDSALHEKERELQQQSAEFLVTTKSLEGRLEEVTVNKDQLEAEYAALSLLSNRRKAEIEHLQSHARRALHAVQDIATNLGHRVPELCAEGRSESDRLVDGVLALLMAVQGEGGGPMKSWMSMVSEVQDLKQMVRDGVKEAVKEETANTRAALVSAVPSKEDLQQITALIELALHRFEAAPPATAEQICELVSTLPTKSDLEMQLNDTRDQLRMEVGLLDREALREEFSNLPSREEFEMLATKYDLLALASKEDLDVLAAKEDLELLPSKTDLELLTVKEDLAGLASKKDMELLVQKSDLAALPSKNDLADLTRRPDLDALMTKDELMTIAEDLTARVTNDYEAMIEKIGEVRATPNNEDTTPSSLEEAVRSLGHSFRTLQTAESLTRAEIEEAVRAAKLTREDVEAAVRAAGLSISEVEDVVEAAETRLREVIGLKVEGVDRSMKQTKEGLEAALAQTQEELDEAIRQAAGDAEGQDSPALQDIATVLGELREDMESMKEEMTKTTGKAVVDAAKTALADAVVKAVGEKLAVNEVHQHQHEHNHQHIHYHPPPSSSRSPRMKVAATAVSATISNPATLNNGPEKICARITSPLVQT